MWAVLLRYNFLVDLKDLEFAAKMMMSFVCLMLMELVLLLLYCLEELQHMLHFVLVPLCIVAT